MAITVGKFAPKPQSFVRFRMNFCEFLELFDPGASIIPLKHGYEHITYVDRSISVSGHMNIHLSLSILSRGLQTEARDLL
jgi:hypothetical protein